MRKNDKNSNNELMEGFRAGHQKCFTEVFNLLYGSLCHYALKYTKDGAASEDIVEDSFIKVWEKRNIFYELPVLKSYFYSTVRNSCLNWIKKTNKFSSLSGDTIDEFESVEHHILHYTVEAETYGNLGRALEQLPRQGRRVIKMLFFEGKKIRIVAEELGISQSAVKTHKERAILSLQKQLARK